MAVAPSAALIAPTSVDISKELSADEKQTIGCSAQTDATRTCAPAAIPSHDSGLSCYSEHAPLTASTGVDQTVVQPKQSLDSATVSLGSQPIHFPASHSLLSFTSYGSTALLCKNCCKPLPSSFVFDFKAMRQSSSNITQKQGKVTSFRLRRSEGCWYAVSKLRKRVISRSIIANYCQSVS